MRFTCDSCGAQYMISDEKVGPNGVKVRCKKCSHVILVRHPPPEPEPVATPPEAPPGEPPRGDGLDEELGQAFDKVMAGGGSDAPAPPHEEPAPPEAQSPAALPAEWYVAIDDQQVGPMAPEGVKARWEAGEVGPDTLVWSTGQADWAPLSAVAELARFLAPVPRPERRVHAPQPAPEPQRAPETQASEPARGVEPDAGWKPGAARALAALANEELVSTAASTPAAAPPAAAGGSLLDSMNLPDSGGVDPTGALPLPIKGLETTGEKSLSRPSAVARTSAEIRLKRSANRAILAAAAVLGLVICGVAAGLWWYFDQKLGSREQAAAVVAPAPVPLPAPPPAATSTPAAPAAPPSPPPTEAAAPPAGQAALAETPAQAGAPTPPAQAAVAPPSAAPPAAAPEPEPVVKAPPKPAGKKKAKAEAKASATRKTSATRVAAATPPPEPAAANSRKKTGDPLLDASDVDADFERELAGTGKAAKRSVYVPPAPGSDLPERLSEAQINEGVASRIDALKQCLEQQTAAQPDAHGTLKMRWVIQGDGTVGGVKAMSPEFSGQPISGCIANVVKTIRFPRSRTAGQEVVFPFRF